MNSIQVKKKIEQDSICFIKHNLNWYNYEFINEESGLYSKSCRFILIQMKVIKNVTLFKLEQK